MADGAPPKVTGLRCSPSEVDNPKHVVGVSKAPFSLIPPVALVALALAMEDGAYKYGEFNFRVSKVTARIYIEAAQRHLLAYLDGEEVAADSGVKHLGHVMACAAILLDAASVGTLVDDRPIPGQVGEALEAARQMLAVKRAERAERAEPAQQQDRQPADSLGAIIIGRDGRMEWQAH